MEKHEILINTINGEDPEFAEHLAKIQKIFDGCRRFIVNQKSAISHLVMGLLAHGPQSPLSEEEAESLTSAQQLGNCGHVSLLGKPGRAKTVLCKTIAELVAGTFSRIQCNRDLEPSGVIGLEVLLPDGKSEYRNGPIFSNIVLADEINRATPKTQAAFLEAMAEAQVSRDITGNNQRIRRTQLLPRPFYVIATQNPIEQDGVYPLPEAQLDRFAMQIVMTGITTEETMRVVDLNEDTYIQEKIKPVITIDELLDIRQFVQTNVTVSPLVKRYAARLAKSLVPHNDLPLQKQEKDLEYLTALEKIHGTKIIIAGRPMLLSDIVKDAMYERMSLVMISVAKALAFIQGRKYVLPSDIKKVFKPVARHRMFLTAKAEGIAFRNVIENHRLTDRIEVIDRVLNHVANMVPIPIKGVPK